MKNLYFFLLGTIFCTTMLSAMEEQIAKEPEQESIIQDKRHRFIEKLKLESQEWAKRLAHKKFSTPVHNEMLDALSSSGSFPIPTQKNPEYRAIEVATLEKLDKTNERALTAALYLEFKSSKPKNKK